MDTRCMYFMNKDRQLRASSGTMEDPSVIRIYWV